VLVELAKVTAPPLSASVPPPLVRLPKLVAALTFNRPVLTKPPVTLRLPPGWTVTDAELAALRRAVRIDVAEPGSGS